MPQVAPQSRNAPAEPKVCLCLRPAAVVAACFLLAAAVVLAYLGGVMSGRATWRSQVLQAQAAAKQAVDAADAGKEGEGASTAATEQGVGQGILAAEDLRFARVLRGESLPPAKTAVAPTPVAAKPGAVPAQAPTQVSGQPSAQAAAPAQPVAPAAGMYDYVFQVGAFKDADSVDGLRQRLEGRGLRTRMERSGKLYVVLVLLRGDQARAAEVVQTAESMGLGKPIQRSKKSVSVQ